MSAFLNLFRLPGEGYANTYYFAAVKNMLTSWSNFFFVSFDAGFVSVDKPPLGLWIRAANAWLFGFSGLSLLLPQAIAGVLPVALIYHLVRRSFGPVAGLLAALTLAVTPISIAVQRNNVMDALLTLLLAAWAFILAAERGSLRWLLLGALVVGLGFNTKMLQAFLALPALYLLYLLAARTTWRRRFMHLGTATVVLFAVSLSWAAAVDPSRRAWGCWRSSSPRRPGPPTISCRRRAAVVWGCPPPVLVRRRVSGPPEAVPAADLRVAVLRAVGLEVLAVGTRTSRWWSTRRPDKAQRAKSR